MHLGLRGQWAYRMRFTVEPQEPVYTKLGYIWLGNLARLLKLDILKTYQLGRLLAGGLLCLLIYRLAAVVFPEADWRRTAWLLAVLGGGLGWLQAAGGWLQQPDLSPVDFWLIDGYVFFGLLAFPHFAAVTALLVVMLLSGLEYLQRPSPWLWLAAALAAVLALEIQPFSPPLADLGLLGAFVWRTRQRRRIVWMDAAFLIALAAVQIPILIYHLSTFSRDTGWASFVQQNITLSPPPAYYAWGFAPFLPVCFLGRRLVVGAAALPG